MKIALRCSPVIERLSSLCNTLQPPQMGSMGMMNPPTMMYSQPVMRPPNPFGSVSSAQVGDHCTELMHDKVSIYLHSY